MARLIRVAIEGSEITNRASLVAGDTMLRRIFQKLQPSLRSNFWRSSKSLYTGKGRIKRPRAVQPFFLPQGGQRRYGTGTGLVPRGFILRVFWTSITAATGYFYYQVGQASTWMTQKIELLHTLGMESLLEALNVWDNLSVAIEESLAWNPFSWKSKTKGKFMEIEIPN